jgi:hypothetical protein
MKTTVGSGYQKKTPGFAQSAETVCRDHVEHAPPKARVEREHGNRGRLIREAGDIRPLLRRPRFTFTEGERRQCEGL